MENRKDAQKSQGTEGMLGLDDEMARELLAHYLGTANERLLSYSLALGESESHPHDVPALESLRRLLHKIAGSAGTYGFPDLTRSARRLEQDVLAAVAAPPGTAVLFDAVRGFQREMSNAFARAAQALRSQNPISAAVAKVVADDGTKSASDAGAPLSDVRPADSGIRERLVIAVIGSGADGDAGAEAVGAALALAGANLIGVGPEHAARGYRRAGGEGLVLWIVPGARSSAGQWVDLPLSGATLPAQCAVVAAAADGAILMGVDGEALTHCGFLLREGKPVVARLEDGEAAAALGKAPVVAAANAEDAVFELLAQLSARAGAR
jgi:HPt (histidine-containing phosphotransfer) domain-containing protein